MKQYLLFSVFLCLVILSGCKSARPSLFDLEYEADDRKKIVYSTTVKPIDSVDVNKLIFDIWKIESFDFPNKIKVYARVKDSVGNVVTGMAYPYKKETDPTYFTAVREKLGKKIIPIDSFTVREFGAMDSVPYAIMLTLDYSGSMASIQETILEATELFTSMKQSVDQIAISTFNKKFSLRVPFSYDKAAIINQYKSKYSSGFASYSTLYDAIKESILEFDRQREMVDSLPPVIIVFSDGDDNFSKTKAAEIYELARVKRVNIFAVGFGYTYDENLEYIAENTGGKYYRAYSRKDLAAIFMDIYTSLKNFYLVTYRPPNYEGLHEVRLSLHVPERGDTMFANGKYDTGVLTPFDSIGKAFSKMIQFDYNSADIQPQSFAILESLADILDRYPRIWLEVQGHTDSIGGESFNQILSEKRANAVVDFLVKNGVESKRLRPRGLGLSQPLATNETPEKRAINRRTQFVIIRK
jgi:outer membrane protein OmpA-like peptidoglycan-associated protein/Mg-chelatase subunit ChlD